MRGRLEVASTTVAAARVIVKRARARGLPVDAAVQAIADARPDKARRTKFENSSAEGRQD